MNATNPIALKKITKARTQLLFKNFFFGRLALYLKLGERSDIPTLATDGKHVYYNPQFVLSVSDEQMRAAMAHEVMHNVLNHGTRRGGRNPKLWNIAADYAINIILQKARFKLGPDWLLDMQYDGMSAEQIYELLLKDAKKQNPNFVPQDLLPPEAGTTGVEAKQIEREWQIATIQTAIEARRAGSVPAGLERFLDELVTPKVPWKDALNRFLTQTTRDDYSWAKPNRKFVSRGMYLPAMHSEGAGHIAAVIDTSGSITQKVFTAFISELTGIMAQVRPDKLTVVSADAVVNHVDVFSRGEPIEVSMHGGGGTDFRPAIDYFADDPPAALVYLTDLYGPTGDAPNFPVLWCCTTDQKAGWGETIELEVD